MPGNAETAAAGLGSRSKSREVEESGCSPGSVKCNVKCNIQRGGDEDMLYRMAQANHAGDGSLLPIYYIMLDA